MNPVPSTNVSNVVFDDGIKISQVGSFGPKACTVRMKPGKMDIITDHGTRRLLGVQFIVEFDVAEVDCNFSPMWPMTSAAWETQFMEMQRTILLAEMASQFMSVRLSLPTRDSRTLPGIFDDEAAMVYQIGYLPRNKAGHVDRADWSRHEGLDLGHAFTRLKIYQEPHTRRIRSQEEQEDQRKKRSEEPGAKGNYSKERLSAAKGTAHTRDERGVVE